MYEQEPLEESSDLSLIPLDTLHAYRYLCAKVGLASGVLTECPGAFPVEPDQLVCMDLRYGSLFIVTRPSGWSDWDEEQHIEGMRRLLASALSPTV